MILYGENISYFMIYLGRGWDNGRSKQEKE